MSELRDRIIDALATEDSNEVIADRILALLPKAPDAGISWGGFNLSGDSPSIAEVRRLIQVEIRAEGLQQAVISLNAQVQKAPELRWEGDKLLLGKLRVGYIAEDYNGQMTLCAGDMAARSGGGRTAGLRRGQPDAPPPSE